MTAASIHPHPHHSTILGQTLRRRAFDDCVVADMRPTVPEHEVRPHQHADMHLLLLLDGAYVSSARGMPVVCVEPVVLLNPPGTEHHDRFRSRDGRFLTLSMASDAYARRCAGLKLGDQSLRLSISALPIAVTMMFELAQWDDASPLAIEQASARLFADAAALRADGAERNRGLQRAIDRLDACNGEPPTLAELAAIAGLHPVYLARAFRQRVGLAPSDYLRRRRVHRALGRIARGEAVGDVATAVGFTDQSHLHRCFVREFGITPGALKRLALARGEVARVQESLQRRR